MSLRPAQVLRRLLAEPPRLAASEASRACVHALVERASVSPASTSYGPHRVGDLVEDVAAVHRVQDAQEEVEIHLQARLRRRTGSSPPDCWKSITRKPSKPELRSASRYSASYMPKRHGPQAPAVKKM